MKQTLYAAVLTLTVLGCAQAEFIVNGDFETVDGRIGLTNNTALDSLSGGNEWWDTYASLPGVSGDSWTDGGSRIEIQRRYQHGALSNFVELDTHGVSGAGAPYCCYNSSMGQSVDITDGSLPIILSFDYKSRLTDYKLYFATPVDPDPDPGDTFAIGVYLNGAQIMMVDNPQAIDWERQSLSLSLAAGTYFLEFRALGTADSLGGLLDNVSMIQIPEPETYFLVGIGLIGFYFLRRKQRA